MTKMINFLKEKAKKHYIALIISGIVLGYAFGLIMKAINISTTNTWAGYIGLLIFGLPVFLGLWIRSNIINETKKLLSTVIKILVIWACVAMLITFTIFLIQETISAFSLEEIVNTTIIYIIVFLVYAILIGLWIYKKLIRNKKQRGSLFIKDTNKKRMMIKFSSLFLGIVLVAIGVFNIIFVSPIKGFLFYSFGFICLGMFVLLKSKDTVEERKTLRTILKVLALYWIISGSLLTVVVFLTYIFTWGKA